MISFNEITKNNYDLFSNLLVEYYREGEDSETDIDTISGFIDKLFDLVEQGEIAGRIVKSGDDPVGICLWMNDTIDKDFREIPGYGTILEIGVRKKYREGGYGTQIVKYAEQQMRSNGISSFYVSAYGPAETFWEKCGYVKTEKMASNGLPIFIKLMDDQCLFND